MDENQTPKKRNRKKSLRARGTRLGFRVNAEELIVLDRKAFMYAGGDMSKYLRDAALNYIPQKK